MAEFNYQNKEVSKLTDEFKQKFMISIKGKEAIKIEGLLAVAHEKGIKSMKTYLVQLPNVDNNWTAICQTDLIGYDWNPLIGKIDTVEYSDIGDANDTNCSAMVKSSYIRMASTRSIARALRKYTNIDVVCASELSDVVEESEAAKEPLVTTDMLVQIKNLVSSKSLSKKAFADILIANFNSVDYMSLTLSQGKSLISILNSYVPQPQVETTTQS